jgi:KEOPS complex subunit Cgi121
MATEVAVVWGRAAKGLEVAGALSAARAFSAAQGVELQLLDASSVVDGDHLRSAAAHALRAKERGTMRTGSLAVELLLYASGRRQIKDAMAVMGLSAGTERVAAVLFGPGASSKAGPLLKALGLAPLSEKEAAGGAGALQRLGVSAKGATPEQLADLALEQVALLDIEK